MNDSRSANAMAMRYEPDLPDFELDEFHARLEALRRLMSHKRCDAVILNSEANLEYFSGFSSPFPWNSPSRALHVLLPLEGEPVAIVPELLESAWRATSWIERMVTWPSPRPADEGVTEIASAWKVLSRKYGRLGAEIGPETRIGMTVGDFLALRDRLAPDEVIDASSLCRSARAVKSPAEVDRISRACRIASDAFDALPGFLAEGVTEAQVVRQYQATALSAGADWVPFVAARSGVGGYDSVVTGPSDKALAAGDVFVLDAGVKYRGYWSDFDRNFAIGHVDDETKKLHRLLFAATEAGIAAARPGAKAQDLYFAQAKVLEEGGVRLSRLGRFGHGLGRQLTEPPSNTPGDETEIRAGMVITIEPGAALSNGYMMVHEENLLITEDGPMLLSRRAPMDLPVVR